MRPNTFVTMQQAFFYDERFNLKQLYADGVVANLDQTYVNMIAGYLAAGECLLALGCFRDCHNASSCVVMQ